MGTMCGLATNDTIGVAPGALWIAANTIVGGNLGNQILQTMQWLADPDGDPSTMDDVPDVANNSWGVQRELRLPRLLQRLVGRHRRLRGRRRGPRLGHRQRGPRRRHRALAR